MGLVQTVTGKDVKVTEKNVRGAQFITRKDWLRILDYCNRGYKKDKDKTEITDIKTEIILKVMGKNGSPLTVEEQKKLIYAIGQLKLEDALPEKLPVSRNIFWRREVLEERNGIADAYAEKLENNVKQRLIEAEAFGEMTKGKDIGGEIGRRLVLAWQEARKKPVQPKADACQ